MAGIYIHIPFCRQACHYCDFHFTTNLTKQSEMVNAICQEIKMRSTESAEQIETIYFGGGTPSLLKTEELEMILNAIRTLYKVNPLAEITLEANPEDLDQVKLGGIKKIGVNRLSIGFQTFSNPKLKWMNRVHSAEEALVAFREARKVNFDNVSVDLIYALPNQKMTAWMEDLKTVVKLNPEHISIYGLTIENQTVFGNRKEKGKLIEASEEHAAKQYLMTIEILESHGYHQYEVSNFSKPSFKSKHNSSYWAGERYLGMGPGAHSYDGYSRRFNIKNNAKYMRAVHEEGRYFEVENLTQAQRMNERILTNLRTIDGIDSREFLSDFQVDLLAKYERTIALLVEKEMVRVNDKKVCLTSTGFLIADEIALKLFFDE